MGNLSWFHVVYVACGAAAFLWFSFMTGKICKWFINKSNREFEETLNPVIKISPAIYSIKVENKYHRVITGMDGVKVVVDVYRVLSAFSVTSPSLQHLVKKSLCAGLRGHKNKRQDLVDILDSAKAALKEFDDEQK